MDIREIKITELFNKVNKPLLLSEIKSKLNSTDIGETRIIDPNKLIIEINIWALDGGQSSYSFLKDTPFYYSKDLLEKYWLNEIKFQLQSRKSELPIDAVTSQLKHQLHIHFGLINPRGKASYYTDAGLGEHPETRIIEFLLKYENIFYIRQKTSGNYQTVVGLKQWLTETSEIDSIKIKSSIISVLRNAPEKKLWIDDIVFGINRFNIETITTKPYNMNLIEKIIENDPKRFNSDYLFRKEIAATNNAIQKAGEKYMVELTDDIEYISYYFKENQKLLKNINYDNLYSGFAAFSFIGKKFPLDEAQEYVKTRPIIYIEQIKDPAPVSLYGSKWLPYELNSYLESLFTATDEVDKWCEENLTISIYSEHFDEIKLLVPKVISHFSPIFNVAGNAGNLFEHILEQKLEIYQKNKEKK